jgi:hypothetical protein
MIDVGFFKERMLSHDSELTLAIPIASKTSLQIGTKKFISRVSNRRSSPLKSFLNPEPSVAKFATAPMPMIPFKYLQNIQNNDTKIYREDDNQRHIVPLDRDRFL